MIAPEALIVSAYFLRRHNRRAETLCIRHNRIQLMAEVGVDAECDDRHTESRCRRNQCLTDTARNGRRAAARIEDAERLNHARDRAQEAEQRGNCNDRTQIVEI